MKKSYTIQYRLDDINDFDGTEYIDGIKTKKEAEKEAKAIIKEYGSRVVMLDICIYSVTNNRLGDETEALIDAYTII